MGLATTENTSNSASDSSSAASSTDAHIREVWGHNLEEEMDRIRDIADSYPYIAMVCIPAELAHSFTCIGYRVPRCSSTSSRAVPGRSRL